MFGFYSGFKYYSSLLNFVLGNGFLCWQHGLSVSHQCLFRQVYGDNIVQSGPVVFWLSLPIIPTVWAMFFK